MGSVVNLMTPQGTVMGRYRWDAWGNKRASVETVANPFGFTGHEHDEETGLVYAKARFYDPEIGLFLSQDPVAGDPRNPPSLHKYLYALQNPTVFVDPDGRVEFLRRWQEEFTNAADSMMRAVDGFSEMNRGLGYLSVVPMGISAGFSEMVGGAIGLVNMGANAAIVLSGIDGAFADEAAMELDETIGSVKSTATAIVEDPGAVGLALVDGVTEVAKGVLEGDPGAMATAMKTITSFALPAPGAGLRKLGMSLKAAKRGVVAARAGLRTRQAASASTRQGTRRLGKATQERTAKTVNSRSRRLSSEVRGKAERLKEPQTNRTTGASAEPRYCFVAGTLVATELGLRPIEEVAVGERVWARDEETGEISLQTVTELFVTPSQETLELELEASDGTVETLGATYGHPFWVEGEGWTQAGELVAGDVLFTERDGWLRVRQVRGPPGVRTVYNLEVEEDHNYFVGRTRAWVHNKLCEERRARLLENLRKNRRAINARVQATGRGRIRERPTPQESETFVGDLLGPDFRPQRSFIRGIRAQYGRKGSTRPDFYNPRTRQAVEVKNYDLSTSENRQRLYRTIGKQLRKRSENLPAGATQKVILDIRGQIVDPAVLRRLTSNIRSAAGKNRLSPTGILLILN